MRAQRALEPAPKEKGKGKEAYVAPATQLQAALAVDVSHLMQSCTQSASLLRQPAILSAHDRSLRCTIRMTTYLAPERQTKKPFEQDLPL